MKEEKKEKIKEKKKRRTMEVKRVIEE